MVLPRDAASASIFSRLQSDPKYSGIADAAARHPKVVEVQQQPSLQKQGLQGQWNMGAGKDSIGLGSASAGLDILAHELTHFLLGNSSYNQTMPHSKQEYVSQSFGDHGNRIPQLYQGQELDQIWKALIGGQ